ncbi:5-deoxy-glucuronate isomerase [Sphingomonas sp. AX6]|uniref:5-deoxy-glucuronate isomerase n=1 Tax=Sphingomonas sp. AX6 TaxID=2653171 RepID=UPI0012F1034D|nr:5-deoxy-glucuronate isomerase [Sphingomonas sp. AX6]VXC46007.1 putative 5-dehydro-4-deoxy-D-glucuronate isomerase [Sphingomonas sp. AX6]
MYDRTYYATHPDMMEVVSNEELRDRYLIQGLFRDGECVLNYTHADRFVIGGVAVAGADVALPAQEEPASAKGHPFLERREMAVVNVGSVEGVVTVDGESFTLGNKDCLYVTMGATDVVFSGEGARFYLASCPAHQGFKTRKLGISDANALERGSLEESNERTIFQLVIPGVCDSGSVQAWGQASGRAPRSRLHRAMRYPPHRYMPSARSPNLRLEKWKNASSTWPLWLSRALRLTVRGPSNSASRVRL